LRLSLKERLMGSTGNAVHIYLNPVQADRADEWETFTRSVILPVVASQRPELLARVRLLRAEGADDGATVFAFVFEGGDVDDYDLEPLFTAEYGEHEGRQRLQQWEDMFVREQFGWSFHEVSLHD
jgi:hypothetical protein